MKKIYLFIGALATLAAANAQGQFTSKKGNVVLPETGDFALGFDAVPFFRYAGNLLNANANNNLQQNFSPFAQPQTIYMKYFFSENTALRMRARIFTSNTKENVFLESNVNAGQFVEDELKTSNFGFTLSAGMEKRRGYKRLQGFYGAEALLGLRLSKQSAEYGNGFDGGTTDFVDFLDINNNNNTNEVLQGQAARINEIKQGSQFIIGARGFVGVEYFFAAKMSVGAEFGWGVNLALQGNGNVSLETAATTTEAEFGSQDNFAIDTDNLDGALFLLFHF